MGRCGDIGQIVLMVSGKGGTGKTSVAVGVGCALAALHHTVLIIDCDVGLRNADILLGLSENTALDFGDVLLGRASLKDAIAAHPTLPQLSLLPAPATREGLTAQSFQTVLTVLRPRYEFILLDGPAGLGGVLPDIAAGADRALVVSTPDIICARDAARVRLLLKQWGVDTANLAVNRVRPGMLRKTRYTIDDMMDQTGLPLIGLIPEDERVSLWGQLGQPVVCRTDTGAAIAYLHIAHRLLGRCVPLMKI